jgi:transposase-like protein
MKVAYLAIEQAAKKWSRPIRDWKPALNQFIILYQDRLSDIFLTAVYTESITPSTL